jgi:Uma2 family endonuclease
MPVSEETYERVALEDPEGRRELVCGRLRRKPEMTAEHESVIDSPYTALAAHLDRRQFRIRASSRLRRITGDNLVPDLFVVPLAMVERLRERPGTFEVFSDPVPLVTEVWSSSTGDYDIATKLADYQARGDLEIWFIHPYHRTLTAWRKQPDGTYTKTLHTTGSIQPVALPNVTIIIDTLFD